MNWFVTPGNEDALQNTVVSIIFPKSVSLVFLYIILNIMLHLSQKMDDIESSRKSYGKNTT